MSYINLAFRKYTGKKLFLEIICYFMPRRILEPAGVREPVAADKGGTYISLSWEEPEFPNGILTGYFLYQENREIYNGGKTEFNVTDLQVPHFFASFSLSD